MIKRYSILTREGNLRSLTDTIDALMGALDKSYEEAKEMVYDDNVELLQSFGCESDRLKEEGFQLFLSISTSASFNAWANEDDGSSGVSAKKLLTADLKPGAILALYGLLSQHPDAHASGSLTMGWSNPVRGRSRR